MSPAIVRATRSLSVTLAGGIWNVAAVVQGVPSLPFGPVTAALLAAISAALTPILLAVPFIGLFLAVAANAILLAIGIGGDLHLRRPDGRDRAPPVPTPKRPPARQSRVAR